jgi:hypothetical protein
MSASGLCDLAGLEAVDAPAMVGWVRVGTARKAAPLPTLRLLGGGGVVHAGKREQTGREGQVRQDE